MQCSPNLCSRRSSRSAGRHAMTRTGRAIQPGGMSIMPIRGSFRGRRSNGSSAFRIAIWTLTPASLIPAPPTSRTEVGGTGDAPSSADDRTPGTALTRRMTQYAPVLVSQEMTNTWLEAFASDIPCDTGQMSEVVGTSVRSPRHSCASANPTGWKLSRIPCVTRHRGCETARQRPPTWRGESPD